MRHWPVSFPLSKRRVSMIPLCSSFPPSMANLPLTRRR
jgi:hypothetical protein